MDLTKEILSEKYGIGLSIREIARQYDISPGTVRKRFSKYEIPLRDCPNRKPKTLQKQLGKRELYSLYIDKELSTTEIGKMYDASAQSVYAMLKKYEIPIRSVQEVNSRENYDISFFEELTPELAYLLGLFASDGNVHPKHNLISIALNDIEVIEWIKNKCKCSNKIYTRGKSHKIAMSGVRLVEIFREYGITPNKSKTIQFPRLPKELISYFIKGVFEGDGSVSAKKTKVRRNSTYRGEALGEYTINGRASIASASEEFSNSIAVELSEVLGRTINVNYRNNIYVIEISAKSDLIKLGEWMYGDKEMFGMERKRTIFREIGADI